MSTPNTFLFAIPLPVVAIAGIVLCVVLKYACCCTKKAQRSRRDRITNSRRTRGRYNANPDGAGEVKIPVEFETPKEILVKAELLDDSTVYKGPPCGDEAPPPYHQGPPPSYDQSASVSADIKSTEDPSESNESAS